MSTNKSSTWGYVVTPAGHHQSHSGNYVTSLIGLVYVWFVGPLHSLGV